MSFDKFKYEPVPVEHFSIPTKSETFRSTYRLSPIDVSSQMTHKQGLVGTIKATLAEQVLPSMLEYKKGVLSHPFVQSAYFEEHIKFNESADLIEVVAVCRLVHLNDRYISPDYDNIDMTYMSIMQRKERES